MANFTRLLLTSSVIVLLILSCGNKAGKNGESIPGIMQPDWKGIDVKQLPVKFGEILKLGKGSNAINAIVLDFDKDEGGIWIGLCLITNNKIFGRQIPSGFVNTGCLNLLDLTYLKMEALGEYKKIELLNIKREEVGIGSITPALNFAELRKSFNFGVEQRTKKQTPCNEGLTDPEAVRECYFEIGKIKN